MNVGTAYHKDKNPYLVCIAEPSIIPKNFHTDVFGTHVLGKNDIHLQSHHKNATPLKWEFPCNESGLTCEETDDMNLLLKKIFDFGFHSVKDDKIYTLIPYITKNADSDLQQIISIEKEFCDEFDLKNYTMTGSDMTKWILKSISELHPYVIRGLIVYFYQEACLEKNSSENIPPAILTGGKNILTEAILEEIEIYRYKMQTYGFRMLSYILMFENLKEVVVKALFSLRKDIIFLEWVGSWTSALYFFLYRRGPFYGFVNENEQDEIIQYTSLLHGTKIQCTESISSLLKFNLDDYYKLIQQSWDMPIDMNGTWSKTKITHKRKSDLKKFRDCVKKYFELLEKQFWFYNIEDLLPNETVKMFSDPLFEDITQNAEIIAGEHWTRLKNTVHEHSFFGNAFLKSKIFEYEMQKRNHEVSMSRNQTLKIGTESVNNAYIVNISTNNVEEMDDLHVIEESLSEIEKKIMENKADIESIEQKIQEKNHLIISAEENLLQHAPTEAKEKLKILRETDKKLFSKTLQTNIENQETLTNKIKKIKLEIQKLTIEHEKSKDDNEREKYSSEAKKLEDKLKKENERLGKLKLFIKDQQHLKHSSKIYEKMEIEMNKKIGEMKKFVSQQKEMLLKKKEILKENMEAVRELQNKQKRIEEENEKNAQQTEDEESEDEEIGLPIVDMNNRFSALENHQNREKQQLHSVKKDEVDDFSLYNLFVTEQDRARKKEQNLANQQKKLDAGKKKGINILNFVTGDTTSKKKMNPTSGSNKQQSAEELAAWRLEHQKTANNRPNQSTSKKISSNSQSTHTVQQNTEIHPNVSNNKNIEEKPQIKGQKVDPKNSFLKIAQKNTEKKAKIESSKVTKKFNFKCTQCKTYQCDEWNDMVSHIFSEKNHQDLQERYRKCKEDDELLTLDEKNPIHEEIFQKAFSTRHISSGYGYSGNNDYDRSKDYYAPNAKLNHKKNINGMDGFDRAARKENKRQGKSNRSNCGHNNHY